MTSSVSHTSCTYQAWWQKATSLIVTACARVHWPSPRALGRNADLRFPISSSIRVTPFPPKTSSQGLRTVHTTSGSSDGTHTCSAGDVWFGHCGPKVVILSQDLFLLIFNTQTVYKLYKRQIKSKQWTVRERSRTTIFLRAHSFILKMLAFYGAILYYSWL